MTKEELLDRLAECVREMEDEEVVDVCHEWIDAGYDPQEGLLKGLVVGMQQASDRYDEGEYFVPELIVCSDAMYSGMEVLQAAMPDDAQSEKLGKVVLGTIEGDTHDIGKSLVRVMLETNGFEVIDLGRDVAVSKFIETTRAEKPDIVGMSSLMTTTMLNMERVVEELKKEGLRDSVKIMVGGAPVSPAFAEKIGAEGYSKNAIEAVTVAKRLVGVE